MSSLEEVFLGYLDLERVRRLAYPSEELYSLVSTELLDFDCCSDRRVKSALFLVENWQSWWLHWELELFRGP